MPEVTGEYSDEEGAIAILEGDNETLVRYEGVFPFGRTYNPCLCTFVVEERSAQRWTLRRLGGGAPWTLVRTPRLWKLQGDGACCGAGFGGTATFSAAPKKPLKICRVKAERAYFRDVSEGHSRREAFVVSGDAVEVVISPAEPEVVLARFRGPKETITGGIPEDDLDCPRNRNVRPQQLRPFGGTWLQLTRIGRGFAIDRPCDGEIRSVTVDPDKLSIDFTEGGKTATYPISFVQADRKGARIGVDVERHRTEVLEWAIIDAKRSIVRLGGERLLWENRFYVSGSKTSAFALSSPAGCTHTAK